MTTAFALPEDELNVIFDVSRAKVVFSSDRHYRMKTIVLFDGYQLFEFFDCHRSSRIKMSNYYLKNEYYISTIICLLVVAYGIFSRTHSTAPRSKMCPMS